MSLSEENHNVGTAFVAVRTVKTWKTEIGVELLASYYSEVEPYSCKPQQKFVPKLPESVTLHAIKQGW